MSQLFWLKLNISKNTSKTSHLTRILSGYSTTKYGSFYKCRCSHRPGSLTRVTNTGHRLDPRILHLIPVIPASTTSNSKNNSNNKGNLLPIKSKHKLISSIKKRHSKESNSLVHQRTTKVRVALFSREDFHEQNTSVIYNREFPLPGYSKYKFHTDQNYVQPYI